MGSFSLWHWLVVIVLVMLLFGRGRISSTMGEIGKGLRSFKEGLSEDEDDRYRRYSEERSPDHPERLSTDEQPQFPQRDSTAVATARTPTEKPSSELQS